MRSVNFEFLQAAAPRLTELAALAESYAHSDPAGCAIKARAFVEQAARDLYADARLQTVPRSDLLELLRGAEFQQVVPSSVLDKMHAIRKKGNVGAHGGDVQPRIALDVIRELFDVARWLFLSRYGGALSDVPEFQPVPPGGATGATKSALQRDRREALQKLAAQNARFEELVGELEKERAAKHTAEAEASRLREAMVSRGPAAAAELQFDEATTRQRLIDTMLVEAGWDVGADGVNTREVEREVEVHDQPTDTGVGKCDYVMWGEDGKPLMLVEVKRTSVDARDGQTQARLYADALARQYGQRPVIVFSNGFEIWLWDDAAGWPPRKLHGHYSKDSIEQLIRQRTSAQPFDSLPVNPAIVDRLYQYEAISRVTERFADTRRKALVVQATGTGKTRVAIALSDLMLRLGRGRRVLFLCDRRELRKQAKDAFTSFTPHSPVIVRASTAKERHHRIYLATYPAMMQVFQSFDPGFFDIIFADESHRSIYNVYGDLFRWFDGYQVGLTATPVEMISRSTCELFGCQRNDPTFNYPYEEAVEDGYLVPFELYTHTTRFLRDGIKGNALTPAQIAELEERGEDPNTLDFEQEEVDRAVFNKDTNRKVLQNLMDEGIRRADGQTLGKSIIFARNHRHALLLRELFDELYPQYGGRFCQVIDNYEPRAEALIDEFKDASNALTIAISVDMLDTGIDVPEVVNLVFAKPVKSTVKFWQIIGRGTRLCPDLFGPGRPKTAFRIFDHWGNFEYHRINGAQAEPREGKGVAQLLFEARIDLAETALRKADLDTFGATTGLLKADIADLPETSIRVREKWREVREAKDEARIDRFDAPTTALLRNDIAPLMQWRDVRGHTAALDLDLLIARLQKTLIDGSAMFANHRDDLVDRARRLPMTLNQVREKAELIRAIQTDAWWAPNEITPERLEGARIDLRGLMKHMQSAGGGGAPAPRTIDVTDDGVAFRHERSRIASVDLATYRLRVKETLDKLFEKDPTLDKIRMGEPVNEADLNRLVSMALTENPDADLRVLKEFYVVAEPLEKIIRSLVGLDATAVDEKFRTFIHAQPQLTAKQQSFLRLLKTHIARHGVIEIDDLYDAPFDKIDSEGPDGVFAEDQVDALLAIIASFEKAPEPKPFDDNTNDEPRDDA